MNKKSSPGSVSQWLSDPCCTVAHAGSQLLWQRFGIRLVRLARQQLRNVADRSYDAEDVAQSTFRELHRGINAGSFSDLVNRKQLWKLLVTISLNKSRNFRNSTFRRRRLLNSLTPEELKLHLHGKLEDPTRSPEWVATVADQCEYLLSLLDREDPSGKLRRLALMRLDGASKSQIAIALGFTRRTVVARIDWIQAIWDEYLNKDKT